MVEGSSLLNFFSSECVLQTLGIFHAVIPNLLLFGMKAAIYPLLNC